MNNARGWTIAITVMIRTGDIVNADSHKMKMIK